MSIRRNGLKALGLSVIAALSLMAFMAAGAQANWLVEGVELKANETVSVAAHTEGKLAVPAKNIEFRCTTIGAEGLKLVASSEKAEGKVKFTGCTAFQISTGTAQANCKPKEPITAGGFALIILHTNGQNYILFSPETGKPFTTVELPELCALAETSPVTGSLVAECGKLAEVEKKLVFSHLDCNTSEVTHLIQPASASLFEADKLKFGANPATLAGIAAVKLSGANVNKAWAGHV
jgi:hypothetical protein